MAVSLQDAQARPVGWLTRCSAAQALFQLLELYHKFINALEPIFGIDVHAAKDDFRQRLGDAWVYFMGRGRQAVASELTAQCGHGKGLLTTGDHKKGGAQAIDVRMEAGPIALEEFGRHEGWGSPQLLGLTDIGDRLGQAEVKDLDPSSSGDHDIRGLYIAVDDPFGVCVFKAIADL